MIGKNLQSLKVPLDMEAIAKGLQDEAAGLSSPINEEDCLLNLVKLQEEKNLKDAITFLEANQKRKGIILLQDGKLQIEIVRKGEGQIVQSYNSPLVRLKKENNDSKPDFKEEILALDEAIPGLRDGIVGMREGEIRKLYIHPELGNGKAGFDPPNSLLMVEVEVIEADASSDAHAASNIDSLPIFRDLDDVNPVKR